jgi:hypothetical protein
MTNFDSISPADRLGKFEFVEVSDATASSFVGGLALVGVEATAEAYGPSTYAMGSAVTRSKSFGPVSIAFGGGTAVAIGDRPSANVNVFSVGDKTIEYTQTYSFNKNMSVARGFVIAIDYP